MAKVKDLTGMKFGRLTVIERTENKGKKVCWLCRCECGNTTVAIGDNLKRNHTTSCGCAKSQDLTGKKFNRLTVISKSDRKAKSGDFYWNCKCECGNTTVVTASSLTRNRIHSCGCYTRELSSKRCKERTGEMALNWKGGITPIVQYLRGLTIVKEWKNETYILNDYKCNITGKHVHGGNSDVHHLKSFNTIVREAHDFYGIKIKKIITEYTEDELQLLEKYVNTWHKDVSNAVLLSEEVHKLFHSLYGYGDNTPEQFEEFKERYMAGEFDDVLKN